MKGNPKTATRRMEGGLDKVPQLETQDADAMARARK